MIVFALIATALAGDGPEISRSRGSSRGIVVLWPRVVPSTDDPAIGDLAARMHDRLYAAAAKVVPYRRVDVRPAPERVCPRSGCRAPAISVMIGHQEGGCAIVGFLHPPGPSRPIAWPIGGEVDLVAPIDFRDPPEDAIVVREFVPCAYAEADYDEAAIVAGLRALTEERSPSSAIRALVPPPLSRPSSEARDESVAPADAPSGP